MSLHLVETVKEHPAIFAVVAGVVVVYFIWPKSSASSSSTGLSDAALASIQAASQASAEDSAAVTTQQDVDATNLSIANLQANVASLNSNNALTATLNNNETGISLASLVNASQNSAQDFITKLAAAGVSTPAFTTTGGTFDETTPNTNNPGQIALELAGVQSPLTPLLEQRSINAEITGNTSLLPT